MPFIDCSYVVRDAFHFFFLLDNSGSMTGPNIEALNRAMADMPRALRHDAERLDVEVRLHVLAFNSGIQWLCGTSAEEGIPVEDINWADISAFGGTNTAGAIRSILPGLSRRLLGPHAYRPIIVLITDGFSDDHAETQQAIRELREHARYTVNVAIGVQDYTPDELEAFASDIPVKHEDDLGNFTDSNKQKLIFSMDNADALERCLPRLVAELMSSIANERQVIGHTPVVLLMDDELEMRSGDWQDDDDWII